MHADGPNGEPACCGFRPAHETDKIACRHGPVYNLMKTEKTPGKNPGVFVSISQSDGQACDTEDGAPDYLAPTSSAVLGVAAIVSLIVWMKKIFLGDLSFSC